MRKVVDSSIMIDDVTIERLLFMRRIDRLGVFKKSYQCTSGQHKDCMFKECVCYHHLTDGPTC